MNLRFKDVSFVYSSGVRALLDVNLQIDSGAVTAIVGENGAGKTTLVKLLNGLLRPTQGQVWVGDWNGSEHSTAELAARVGFLFQNPKDQLFERSAQREVAFGPRNLGFRPRQVELKTRRALKQVGLQASAGVNPYDLHPFERKLLALASMLAMDTPVTVLDEPSVGQDAAGRARIARIVRGLRKKGRTIVLISHDVEFCAELADRVVVMADGRILADGRPADVFARASLLKKAAVLPPQLVRLAQALKMHSAPLTVRQFIRDYSQWRQPRKK